MLNTDLTYFLNRTKTKVREHISLASMLRDSNANVIGFTNPHPVNILITQCCMTFSSSSNRLLDKLNQQPSYFFVGHSPSGYPRAPYLGRRGKREGHLGRCRRRVGVPPRLTQNWKCATNKRPSCKHVA